MVFIIDLPRLESAEQRDEQTLTPFAEELFYFLRMQTLDEKLISSLRNYDFSETSRYGFVHSMWVQVFDGEMFFGGCGLTLSLQGRLSLGLRRLEENG